MNPLSFKELQQAFNNGEKVMLHPDFDYERWKDGAKGILVLTDIIKMDKWFYIGYKCSGCSRCNSKNISYATSGHHQLIKENGNHIHDKVIFIESKKKTEIRMVSNPVFIKEQNGKERLPADDK